MDNKTFKIGDKIFTKEVAEAMLDEVNQLELDEVLVIAKDIAKKNPNDKITKEFIKLGKSKKFDGQKYINAARVLIVKYQLINDISITENRILNTDDVYKMKPLANKNFDLDKANEELNNLAKKYLRTPNVEIPDIEYDEKDVKITDTLGDIFVTNYQLFDEDYLCAAVPDKYIKHLHLLIKYLCDAEFAIGIYAFTEIEDKVAFKVKEDGVWACVKQ